MKNPARILLRVCLLAPLPVPALAQNQPFVFEAESAATISPEIYATGTLDGASYVTIIGDSPGFGTSTR